MLSKNFQAEVFLVGERLDLRSFEKGSTLDIAPLTLEISGGGIGILFRYGSVVFFDVSKDDQDAFLEKLKPFVIQPTEHVESEAIEVLIKPEEKEKVEEHQIMLREFTLEHAQAIGDILAKTVILDSYETKLSKAFDTIDPLAHQLSKGSYRHWNAKQILQHIGDALRSEHKMVGRAEVSEKPEVLWEYPSLERLYARLEDEFEIRTRHIAVNRKIQLISKTAETLLGLIQHRYSSRLEWYIIILIGIEIVISLYELFIR